MFVDYATLKIRLTDCDLFTDGRHRHCGAILQGTKGVTSLRHVMEIQFHSDENDNTTQDFRHATRLLKGVWLHFTPGSLTTILIILIILITFSSTSTTKHS